MSDLRATDYALLSQATYKDPVIDTRTPSGVVTYKEVTFDGVTYKPIAHADNPANGFQATAYERQDGSHAVVIAYRGTEFDREPRQDGLVDAGMAIKGVNAQTADSEAFTRQVLSQAKLTAELNKVPLDVTVTGHSLGGTLAEINAYKYGLHGQTFNAFGAAGLTQGIPAGGNQIIDNVRATDVVSSASAHFGQVRVFAVPQDTQALSQAGYSDSRIVNALTPQVPILGKIQSDAHAIDNFVPQSHLLGQSIMNPQNEKYAQVHHTMIEPYRNQILVARTVALGEYELNKPFIDAAEQGGKAAVHGAQRVGQDVVHGYDTARDALSRGMESVEQAVKSVAQDEKRTYDRLTKPSVAAPILLDSPTHPDHALYRQSLDAVHRLDAQHGRIPDQHSTNLAASTAVVARASGLNEVHHVVLSDDGSHAFAVQGDLRSPNKQVAKPVETGQAVQTSVAQSSAAWQHNAQQAQTQQQIQQQAPPIQQQPQQPNAQGMGR
jgi:hypothetical protein